MKKIIFFAAVLLVAAGCSRELELIDVQGETSIDFIEDTHQVTVIHAGFEDPETKTSIQMNEAGTVAKVLWTAGDQIKLYGITASNTYYSDIFETQIGGVSSTDFSCSSWNPNNRCVRYVAFYPSDKVEGFGLTKIGVLIPPEQTAVADGIAEKLNISYSSAESISEHFTFRNIPALIKFSLKGAVVPSIDSIKFIANKDIAGEVVISNLDAENPTYNYSSWYGDRVTPTNTVKLLKPTGGFVASDDEYLVSYYIAVYPGTSAGFSMVFYNGEGKYVVKTSNKTMDLVRSQITDMGTINVGDSFGDPLVTEYKTKSTDSGVKPVDIVVIPDGFTKNQRELFESRARDGIDFLFGTEPYKSYEDYFNVYFIWAPSKDEGASITDGNGTITTFRDTAFGSRWGDGDNNYGDMQADADKVFGFVSSHCPEIVRGELTIDQVPVLLIINDKRYGGRAMSYGSGRTYCLAPFTRGGGDIYWSYPSHSATIDTPVSGNYNDYFSETPSSVYAEVYNTGTRHIGNWKYTLVHEFGGHSFGRLKDEYWYSNYQPQSALDAHSWPVPFGLNVTGQYSNILWQDLLTLVSGNPAYSRVGIFQGGDVSVFNRWRSERVSCMIDNRPYFSAWQRVLIAKRITELAGQTFSLNGYLSIDVTTDPIRDNRNISDDVNVSGPVVVMPPLPPPILIDNTTQVEITD